MANEKNNFKIPPQGDSGSFLWANPVSATDYLNIGSIGIFENINSLDAFSTGLGVGISNEILSSNYSDILSTQKNTYDSIVNIGNEYNLTAHNLNNIAGSMLIPTSGAIADIGLATVNADKMFGLGTISANQFTLTENISSIFLDALNQQQQFVDSTLAIPKNSEMFYAFDFDSISSSSKMIGDGISSVMSSLSVYPTEIVVPNLEIAKKTAKLTEMELSKHQKNLDEKLDKIDPDLKIFRSGAWVTFNEKKDDYISQATSSMRRLVDNLLRALAPNEEVIKTDYFKKSKNGKDNKDRPTRKARLLYAVKYDQKKAEHLMRLVDGLLEAYDNLSAWDHTSLQQHDFVYGIFIVIEGSLISLLSEQ